VSEPNARVRFELESRPENVALVRTGLAALDDVFSLGELLLTDLKTAVSEACNNVVVHAYPDALGPMFVSIECGPDVVEVVVRDDGAGIRKLAASEDRMGLGLGVMSALADRVEFRTPREGGTEVKMCFRRSDEAPFGFFRDDEDEDEVPLALSGDAVIWFQPVSLMGPVLGRIFRAVAATSQFTLERFADLYAVTDALAAYAEYASAADTIGIAITGAPRRLELVGGPFAGGSGPPRDPLSDETREMVSRRDALSKLVDGLTINELGDQATLQLVLVDETRG
jgi:serine/threonine-protein kinase RsbW